MDDYRRSCRNGFSAHGMDRLTHRRADDQWIAERMEDRSTRFVPVWRSRHLCAHGEVPLPVLASREDLGDVLSRAESVTFLGEAGGRSVFAVGLPSGEASIPSRLGRFLGLREVAPLVDHQEAALLAYARAITHWHRGHRFCGDCGSPTASAEGGHVRVCTSDACGRQHFPRTDPAIIVLVARGERCLLGRQSRWVQGVYSTIAGFVEPGESLEDAVLREVLEETGVKVGEVHYHSSQPWPFPSSIMLGFTATATNDEIRLDDQELEDAQWFSRQEVEKGLRDGTLRLPSRYSIAYRLIEDWFDASEIGALKRVLDWVAPNPGSQFRRVR